MNKSRCGFTLLELMVVVAIVALFASIAIPALMASRRKANESSVFANLRNFATSMSTYSQDQDNQCFPKSRAYFGDYFSHLDPRGGYKFYYTCNVSCYIYYACPHSLNKGRKAYFVDESGCVYAAKVDKKEDLGEPTISFDYHEIKRITKPKLTWKKES